jgi:hypothetical protein
LCGHGDFPLRKASPEALHTKPYGDSNEKIFMGVASSSAGTSISGQLLISLNVKVEGGALGVKKLNSADADSETKQPGRNETPAEPVGRGQVA